MLVALVLDAVGVAREAVIADYALSAEHVEAMFRRWTTARGVAMPDDLTPHLPRAEVIATVLSRLDAEHVEAMWRRWTTAAGVAMPDDLGPHLPRAEVIETVLARLDDEHGDGAGGGAGGGAAGWLRANGLEDDVLHRLPTRLTGR